MLNRPRFRRLAAAAAVLLILGLTLLPSGDGAPPPFAFHLDFEHRWLSAAILNVWLFIPLGLALGWKSRSPVFAIAGGLLLSTAIELTQTAIPGRDGGLNDILSNTLGTALGVLVALHPTSWLAPDAKRSRLLTLASLTAVASIMAGSALLLWPIRTPLIPQNARYQFVSSGAQEPETINPIFVREVPSTEEPLFIGRAGNDLLLGYPTLAGAAGLDQPEYWLAGAFPDRNRDTVPMLLRRERARWQLSAGGQPLGTLGPTIGQGWALLAYPNVIGRRWGALLSALWLVGLCVPIGFWANERNLFLFAAVGVALALALIPQAIGAAPSRGLELAGAAAGLLAGASLRWLAYLSNEGSDSGPTRT